MNTKPECDSCGGTTYEGELRECPYCLGTKCSDCDMGCYAECGSCQYQEEDNES